MTQNQTLYHGTCKAFEEYARQNSNKFGPDYDSVSFTPDWNHAAIFATSWRTKRGLTHLKEYFGIEINSKLSNPVIIEFDSENLGKLNYRKDCGVDEYYLEKGPVDIAKASKIYELIKMNIDGKLFK